MGEAADTDSSSTSNNKFASEDPVILDAFADLKAAILAKRTDIVRKILSAAQSMRDDDEELNSGEEELLRKEVLDKYDSEEFVDLLSLLLKHQDTDSGTLLHYATRVGSIDIVRTLLAAGVNCAVENSADKTAYEYCDDERMKQIFVEHLMQSVSQSRLFRIKQILSLGIDVNSNDGAITKNSVLHWASSFADVATLKYILASGANVNIKNGCGATPLHDAVHRKDLEIIKELLMHGADKDIKAIAGSFVGQSPREMAAKSEIEELIDLFEIKNAIELEDSSSKPVEGSSSWVAQVVNTNLPRLTEVDRMCQYFCPQPKIIKQFEGVLFVAPTDLDVLINNSQYTSKMHDIISGFVPKFQSMGINLKLKSAHRFLSSKSHIQCSISSNAFTKPDQYKIQFTTTKVIIIGSSIRSFFYSMCTVLQSMKIFKGKAIPLIQIYDWPTFRHRSIRLDFSNTDFPSFTYWQSIIDTLAIFKINCIQLNSNIITNDNYQTPLSDMFHNLQIYAQKRFIDIVPFVRISDHSNLLSNANNNGLYSLDLRAFDSLLNPFLCQTFVHVDLSNLSHSDSLINQLEDYFQYKECFLELSFDDHIDIGLETLSTFLDACSYSVNISSVRDVNEIVHMQSKTGMNMSIHYENNTLNRLFPDLISYTNDLFQILNNACWESNTNIGLCASYVPSARTMYNISLCLPSLIFANAMAWSKSKMDDAYMENVLNYLYYEDDNDIMGKAFMEVCTSLPVSDHISVLDHLIDRWSLKEVHVRSQSLQDICKAIKVNRSMVPKTQLKSTFKDHVIQEFNIISNIAYFLARLCYLMLSFNKCDRHLSNLHTLQRSDNANRLMTIIKEIEDVYKPYYVAKDGKHMAYIETLNGFLEELLPQTPATPTSPLFSVFTI